MQPTGSFGFAQILAGGRRTHLLYTALSNLAHSARSTHIPKTRARVSIQLAIVAPGSTLPGGNQMRVALYTRVSTHNKGQETANQLLQLRECCHAQNLSILREYEDHESGAKSERTGFQEMLRDAAARRFDVLVFWSLDRLTREGTLATLKYLELLESHGVRWRSLTEPWIDSAGPFRDVIISLLASLAKQERVRISERVRAGLTRARQYGTRSGNCIGRPRALFQRDRALELRRQGLSWRKIAKIMGVSPTTIRRACQGAQLRADTPQSRPYRLSDRVNSTEIQVCRSQPAQYSAPMRSSRRSVPVAWRGVKGGAHAPQLPLQIAWNAGPKLDSLQHFFLPALPGGWGRRAPAKPAIQVTDDFAGTDSADSSYNRNVGGYRCAF